jgi:aminoglycoside phosphotransferase family enzyme/predicted kinase
LNQRLAPNAYLDVVSVTRVGRTYHLGGEGRAHEVAVWMRRLPAGRMLDRLVESGAIDHRLMEDIGRTIAGFHARAATGPAIAHFGRQEAIARNLAENLARTGRFPAEVLPLELRRAVVGFLRQSLRTQRRRLAERVRAGRVRDCHGDLQAQHICCTDPIQIFDCIEFNHRFRYGDTAGEIAFLAMDLDALGRPDLALDFLNAYLDVSGDYAAVPLLDFYRAYRAWIRGKVYGLQAVDPARADRAALVARARGYFDLAAAYARPRGTPALTVMTGLSASGKSTVAREIAHAGQAIVVRTDAVRKQLAGVPWHERHAGGLAEGLYAPGMTQRTYAACLDHAADLLGAGWSVVLDGVFGRRAERDAPRALAQRLGAAFRIAWCGAPEAVLRERLRARAASGRDLSDAGEAVLDLQLRHYESPVDEPDVERHGH